MLWNCYVSGFVVVCLFLFFLKFLLLELSTEILSLENLKQFLSIFLSCFALYNLMGSSCLSYKGKRVLWHRSSCRVGLKYVAHESASS